ncbi:hypothetical protein ACG0Z6_14335 [Roseateles sp. BYS180W]|uniref:Uncharacterized protein n=1 Tax=Roseateles rivi TaxID=3299028 RepID=A0ABW7FYM7_9BURK
MSSLASTLFVVITMAASFFIHNLFDISIYSSSATALLLNLLAQMAMGFLVGIAAISFYLVASAKIHAPNSPKFDIGNVDRVRF